MKKLIFYMLLLGVMNFLNANQLEGKDKQFNGNNSAISAQAQTSQIYQRADRFWIVVTFIEYQLVIFGTLIFLFAENRVLLRSELEKLQNEFVNLKKEKNNFLVNVKKQNEEIDKVRKQYNIIINQLDNLNPQIVGVNNTLANVDNEITQIRAQIQLIQSAFPQIGRGVNQ